MRRSNNWGKRVAAVLAVVLVMMGAVWMTGISDAVATIKQTTEHNSQALANQQAQLSAIDQKLNGIQTQLTQLGQEIRSYFSQLLNEIKHNTKSFS